jgi:predicted nucleotidyltransferase component of viral defense system
MTITSGTQLKDLIKNLAHKNSADSQILLRSYITERFLERLSDSKYKNNFIIKGGMLISAMVGIKNRSTMDLDASIKGFSLNTDELKSVVESICSINLNDGVTFEIKSLAEIMDEADYPGIRISMNGFYDGIRTPVKLDISTGDVITPNEIVFSYQLMFENRKINLWSYNIETVLAEKLESMIARTITNTRMRDFYDVYLLTKIYSEVIDYKILNLALKATSTKRNTITLMDNAEKVFDELLTDSGIINLWQRYQSNYNYANGISWNTVVDSAKNLYLKIK